MLGLLISIAMSIENVFTPIMVVGVSLIVIGSLVMNRKLVANGWLEPLKEIVRQKGSRYMTLDALLLAGVILFSCNNFITLRLALILACGVLCVMSLALYWTRPVVKSKS